MDRQKGGVTDKSETDRGRQSTAKFTAAHELIDRSIRRGVEGCDSRSKKACDFGREFCDRAGRIFNLRDLH